MEKKIFTSKETTKEQYLKFKEYIKSDAFKDHSDYVAYYIFKHRIQGADRDAYLLLLVEIRQKLLPRNVSEFQNYLIEKEAL